MLLLYLSHSLLPDTRINSPRETSARHTRGPAFPTIPPKTVGLAPRGSLGSQPWSPSLILSVEREKKERGERARAGRGGREFGAVRGEGPRGKDVFRSRLRTLK